MAAGVRRVAVGAAGRHANSNSGCVCIQLGDFSAEMRSERAELVAKRGMTSGLKLWPALTAKRGTIGREELRDVLQTPWSEWLSVIRFISVDPRAFDPGTLHNEG